MLGFGLIFICFVVDLGKLVILNLRDVFKFLFYFEMKIEFFGGMM